MSPLIHQLKVLSQAATDEFYNIMKEVKELNEPIKWFKLRGDKPWMKRETKRLIGRSQALLRQSKMDQWKRAQQIKRHK